MNKILSITIACCFIIVTVITSIDFCCFDQTFYREQYQKLQVNEDIGIDFEDLMDVTSVLLDYTQAKRSDMIIYKAVNGIEREIFNQKEKLHMADVQQLYLNAMLVRNIAFVTMLIALAINIIMFKRQFLWSLCKYYNKVSLIFLLFLGTLIAYALVDFNTFWINFHHIFFAGNNLWLLNPNTDILIMMVPEQFFFDLVFKIIMLFVLVFSLTNGLARYYYTCKMKELKI